jgi:hypothetical protein
VLVEIVLGCEFLLKRIELLLKTVQLAGHALDLLALALEFHSLYFLGVLKLNELLEFI